MEQPTRFIGMDVHKDTIVVAVTTTGDIGTATSYGTFPNTTATLEHDIERAEQHGSFHGPGTVVVIPTTVFGRYSLIKCRYSPAQRVRSSMHCGRSANEWHS
jgi:hypothetical protein